MASAFIPIKLPLPAPPKQNQVLIILLLILLLLEHRASIRYDENGETLHGIDASSDQTAATRPAPRPQPEPTANINTTRM